MPWPRRSGPERPRRWGRTLAVVGIGVAMSGALAPTLLSTSAGNRWLIAAINERIAGQLEAERIAMGWLSGVSAHGVTLRDAEGELVAHVSRVETDLALVEALRRPLPLGNSEILIDAVHVVAYPDGTNSLTRALGPPSQQPAASSSPTELPFTGDVRLAVAEVTAGRLGREPLRAKKLSGRLLVETGRLALDLESTVDAPGLESSRFRSHVRGELDRERRRFVVTEPSTIVEGLATSGAGRNELEVAAGSRLSWGEEPSDVTLHVTYDLRRLSTLFAPLLPGSLTVSGRDEATIHVRGALTSGAGLRRLRNMTIDPTSFAYERIEARGLTLANGRVPIELSHGRLSFRDAELPANGGVLVLAGYIDLRGATPRHVVEAPHVVVRNVALNAQLAAGPFKFLPVSWGLSSDGGVSGVVSVHLENASLPLSKSRLARDGRAKGHVDVVNLDADAPAVGAIARALGPFAGAATVRDQRVRVPFELESGRLHFTSVALNAGALRLTFAGFVDLDGSIQASSTVKVGPLQTPATVEIAGTVRHPQVTLTSALAPADAQRQLQQVPGLLEKLVDEAKDARPKR